MQAPVGVKEDLVGYPEYANDGKTIRRRENWPVLGTPEDWGNYFSLFVAAFIKEVFCTMVLTFAVLTFVSQSTGAEPIAKKFIVGLVYLLGYYLCYSLGNVRGIPRHCNLAVTVFETLSGRVPPLNFFFIYLLGAAVGSTFAALIAYTLPNIATVPVISLIGRSQGNQMGGAIGTVVVGSTIIALFMGHLTSYLQFNSKHHYLHNRPVIAAVAAGITVAVCYISFGVFNLDSWTYFAGCVATSIASPANVTCWTQTGPMYQAFSDVTHSPGAWPMWLLVPIIGGFAAFALDWVLSAFEARAFSDVGKVDPADHIAAPAAASGSSKRSASASASGRRNASSSASNLDSLRVPLNSQVW